MEFRSAAFVVCVWLVASACTETKLPGTGAGSKQEAALYWTGTPGDMSVARAQLEATVLSVDGGPVLVTGGVATVGGAPTASAELFWPDSGTFAPVAPMNVQRSRHAAVRLNDGSVFAIGGTTASGISRDTELYVYSADGGAWTASGQMLNARADHAATLLQDGRVLVTGGLSTNSLPLAAAEVWGGSLWVLTLPMGTARAGHTATRLSDGRVLVVGGHDGTNALNTAEIMSAGLSAWSATAPMTTRRQFHRAVLLPGATDRVLVAGGVDGSGTALSSAELYDVASNTWTTVGALNEARSAHTLTLLSDGGVVAVGGLSAMASLSSAELFTLTADGGVWSPSGCTLEPRGQHAAVLLGSGRVLVAGGKNGSTVLDSAEVHDPNGGLPNGAACTRGCECASQSCVDGVCCNTACGGACEACNLGGSVGTCSNVDAGSPGEPVCAPYVCTGADPACPNSCNSDVDCVASHHCVGNVCVPRSPNGTSCADGGTCASGACVDGVCCESACDSSCDSCNQPGREGQCRPTPMGQQGSPSCAPFACNGTGTTCPSSCGADGECDAAHHCVNGACVPRAPNGNTCTADSECVSNFCVDGFCCDGRCNGSCNACNVAGAEGTCTVLAKGHEGAPVCAPNRCDGVSGECPTSCETKDDCADGARCVDKVCVGRNAGYIGWSWACSMTDGSALLLALLTCAWLLRRKRGAVVGAVVVALIAFTAHAADDAPLMTAVSPDAAPKAAAVESAQPKSGGGIISVLSGLHVGGYLLGDFVAEQVGGELQLTYAVMDVLDLGVAGVLGDNIGLRAVGTLHTGTVGGTRWQPFLQLRAIVHPVTRGLGLGGGAWGGASYELGPGRARAGVLGEIYRGPANYFPYAIVAAVGYEVDPFQTEVQERIVEKAGPTRFRGRITDLDDHVIKGRVTFRTAPEPLKGKTFNAEPSFDIELPPGEYDVIAESDGHLARGRFFEIHEGETVVSDFALRPVPGTKGAQLTDERIEILQSIQFEFDKATILPVSYGILDEVVDILVHHEALKIRIEGHTDRVGTADYNQKLSQARAASVRSYLIEKGVDARRLTSQGFGFSRPIAGDDEAGRAKNRRVQFEIVR